MIFLVSDIDAPLSQGAQCATVDQSKLDTLISFGFQEEVARKALKASVKFFHLLCSFMIGSTSDYVVFNITRKSQTVSFMYESLQGGDIEKATDWIFNNPDASAVSDMDATTSSTAQTPADAGLTDGGGS